MALTKDELLQQARAELSIIDGSQIQTLIESGAILLDVREPGEFNQGHLPQAVHIPRGLLEFMVGNHPALQQPDHPLVVYCKNGGRSTLAAHTLQLMGFSQVKMLEGGFDGWQGQVQIPENQYK